MLKNARRKETLCLRRVSREVAIEKNAWFYLANNCCMSILYNLRRINEVCREHVANNFLPLPPAYLPNYTDVRSQVTSLLDATLKAVDSGNTNDIPQLRRRCSETKVSISDMYHRLYQDLHQGDPSTVSVLYVYLNMLQETREMVSNLHKYLRAYAKLYDTEFSGQAQAAWQEA